METVKKIRPSAAENPDLDWSQVRETVIMLNVAIAQIETALRNGDDSVNSLADSFTSMVGHVETIGAAAQELPDSQEASVIDENCHAVSEKMQHVIVAFQFYDKLTQRLSHLSNSLGALSELVDNPARLYNPYEWKGLQQKIKSKYTVDADRAMFDAILKGHSMEEALKICENASSEEKADNEDVELF